MSPTTATDASTRSTVTTDGGSETILAPLSSAPPAKPTFDDLFDEMQEMGFTPRTVNIAMRMFKRTAKMVNRFTGVSNPIDVDMEAHDLLEAIMKDRVASGPGSLHERLELHFLPEGYAMVHDFSGDCTLQAFPKSELINILGGGYGLMNDNS